MSDNEEKYHFVRVGTPVYKPIKDILTKNKSSFLSWGSVLKYKKDKGWYKIIIVVVEWLN